MEIYVEKKNFARFSWNPISIIIAVVSQALYRRAFE